MAAGRRLAVMVPESAPGLAITWAHRIIVDHAEARSCDQCRARWCPTAEWALWVVVTEHFPPPHDDGEHLVTVVARQVLTNHWPRGVDGCRPCGLPDCTRMQVAATWLEVVRDPYTPPAVQALLPSRVPTNEELRRITGMG
ncbi:hypothetical protein ABGB07_39840 [Micromonosporaceae bacterium B7E4]